MKLTDEHFRDWLQTKGLGSRTIIQYLWYLEKFGDEKVCQNSIISFLQKHNNPVCRAFINNYLAFRKTQGIKEDIALPKISGRKRTRLPNILSLEEIEKISKAMITERDAIMVLLGYYGGLRISELINIKPYDFQWTIWTRKPSLNGSLKVIGKGDKQRMVYIPQKLMARIYQWIKNSVANAQSKDTRLFNISVRRFEHILAKGSLKAIGRHVNPHSLRHSMGTALMNSGWNLKEIADYLGHQSITTTQIYTHVNAVKLKDKFSEFISNE